MNTAAPRIIVEETPNQEIHAYYLTAEICTVSEAYFKRPLQVQDKQDLAKIGHLGSKLVHCLFDIDGVMEIIINPYRIIIVKAYAFRWEEIEPRVTNLLRNVFSGEKTPVHMVHNDDKMHTPHYMRPIHTPPERYS